MTDEEKYQKRFNQGYWLAKFDPDFADMLASAYGNSEDLENLKAGQKQFTEEHEVDYTPDWLTDKAKDLQKDDPAPEKDKGTEPEL